MKTYSIKLLNEGLKKKYTISEIARYLYYRLPNVNQAISQLNTSKVLKVNSAIVTSDN